MISEILKDKYGFDIKLLIDANYETIVNSIIQFTKNRERSDNLLIYYAGHGELDDSENRGYWLPIDAGVEQDSKWVSNAVVKDKIKATKAKHVLLMVDSCFAGSLLRGSGITQAPERLNKQIISRYQLKTTRLVMTSGGNEPVEDSDVKNHSAFAYKIIDVLKNNNNVMQSVELFQNVSTYVIDNAGNTPNYSTIHNTGHDGGQFLFFPIK